MQPTDIRNPDYFHRVVDCQWACPAHTPVPEYIRLIAAGRYADAYMVNWNSNVFPGILGRTCDRPCEPACRRGRVEQHQAERPEPVAICRLKRVAADFKDDITGRLPKRLGPMNGRRVACVGAGPASLTVARDLAPLGYHVTVFDQDPKAGGMIRTQIPRFRLPEEVIDEETGYVLGLGVEFRGGVADRIDEVAARGEVRRDLRRVGRAARPRPRTCRAARKRRRRSTSASTGSPRCRSAMSPRSAGASSCSAAGNTAMDCCRTAKRLGGEDVKVIVRSGFAEMKASPWEKEDAMHEGIPILDFLVPKAFLHENGRLTGMRFEKVKAVYDAKGHRALIATGEPDPIYACDEVLVAVGQENAFPWIERDAGIEFDQWGMPVLDKATLQSTLPRVFFGGDAALGPKNIIWAVAQGHDAAISIDKFLHGEDVRERPAPGVEPHLPEDGHPRMELRQRSRARRALQGALARRQSVAQEHPRRGRTRLRPRHRVEGGAALPELRRPDRVHGRAVHRVRRVRRHLPHRLHQLHRATATKPT